MEIPLLSKGTDIVAPEGNKAVSGKDESVAPSHSAAKAATKSYCHPWLLGPGIPCRDDGSGVEKRMDLMPIFVIPP